MRSPIALSVLVAASLLTAGLASGQAKAPPDFTIPKAESSPGPVTFSHGRHLPKVGKCTRCHMRDIKLKRGGSGPFTMDAMQQGKTCGACHDGKTSMGGAPVFSLDECDRCHRS